MMYTQTFLYLPLSLVIQPSTALLGPKFNTFNRRREVYSESSAPQVLH